MSRVGSPVTQDPYVSPFVENYKGNPGMGAKVTRLFWKQEAKSSILLSLTACLEILVLDLIIAIVVIDSSTNQFVTVVQITNPITMKITHLFHGDVSVVILTKEADLIAGNLFLQYVILRLLNFLAKVPTLQVG